MKKDILQKFITQNVDLNRLQDALVPRFNAVAKDPMLNRQELVAEFAAAGAVVVQHTLGRVPDGWVLTDKSAGADIWRSAWTDASITLNASAAVNVSFFVF